MLIGSAKSNLSRCHITANCCEIISNKSNHGKQVNVASHYQFHVFFGGFLTMDPMKSFGLTPRETAAITFGLQ